MFDFVGLIKDLAVKSKDIGHSDIDRRFYRMSGIKSLEEVLTNLLSAKVPAIGVEDSLDGRLLDNSSDGIFDRQYCVFYVFGRAGFLNHTQREEEKRGIKAIAMKFVVKLRQMHLSDYNMQTNHGLRGLDVNSFSYRTIAPLPEGLIALAVSFVVDRPFQTKLNPEDWDNS